MEIIKDFISKEYQDYLEKFLLEGMRWNYRFRTSYDRDEHRTLNTPFFVHVFYFAPECYKSEYFFIIVPIIKALEEYKGQPYFNRIFRIKANLYTKDGSYPEDFHHPPHVDQEYRNWRGQSLIYYVNDADGDTFFFNENYSYETGKYGGQDFKGNFTNKLKCSPQKGKSILFDNTQSHTSSPPRKGGPRITLNFVFGEYVS
jgi:hypothetical protein